MPIYDENNNVSGVMVITKDISCWNTLNREMDKSKDQLNALYNIFDTDNMN